MQKKSIKNVWGIALSLVFPVIAFVAVYFFMPAPGLMAPEVQGAGLVPCGTSATGNDKCTLCHLVVGVWNVIQWGMRVMTFFALVVIVAMGILYIASAGNSGMIDQAKKGIKTALFGFALMLLFWVLVNWILTNLAKTDLGIGKTDWSTFTCSTESKVVTGGGVLAPPAPPTAGACAVMTSGPCTTDKLGAACSAWNPESASMVCNKESGGNTTAQSVTDKCADGATFSFGLFQLNIIANGSMLGSVCRGENVFSKADGSSLAGSTGNNGGCLQWTVNSNGVKYCSKWNCRVKDQNLYQTCRGYAYDAAKNISAACTLYQQSGWGPWPVTKRLCGL